MIDLYFAGGCLWGVQEFMRHLPGVITTEAGRANGSTQSTQTPYYDGYAECVKVTFNPNQTSITALMEYFFEIIDPYSIDQQGDDIGKKYRTGVYSLDDRHLADIRRFLSKRSDFNQIKVEVLPLKNYVRSENKHQDRLTRFPNDDCHIPKSLLEKYKTNQYP